MGETDELTPLDILDRCGDETDETYGRAGSEDDNQIAQLDAKLEIVNCLLNFDLDLRDAIVEGELASEIAARVGWGTVS